MQHQMDDLDCRVSITRKEYATCLWRVGELSRMAQKAAVHI